MFWKNYIQLNSLTFMTFTIHTFKVIHDIGHSLEVEFS